MKSDFNIDDTVFNALIWRELSDINAINGDLTGAVIVGTEDVTDDMGRNVWPVGIILYLRKPDGSMIAVEICNNSSTLEHYCSKPCPRRVSAAEIPGNKLEV